LRHGRDNGPRENLAIFTDSGPFHNGYVGTYPSTLPYLHIFVDGSKRLYHYIVGYLGRGVYVC